MNEQQDTLRAQLLESVTKIIDSDESKIETPEVVEDTKKEEITEEVKEDSTNPTEEEIVENEEIEDTTEEDKEEIQEEEEVKENSDDKGLDLKKKLSGQPREFRDAVESIKDPEAQAKVLEAGKILRAREDQVRLELGNTKKELASFRTFDESFKNDPIKTLKDLAKFAKIDLSSLIDSAQDEYDYRTPEEIAKDNYYKNIESRLSQIETQKQRDASEANAREIEQFKSAKDSNGNFKYPHFDKVRTSMAVFYSEGSALYNPDLTLEQAYKKAILLDDDLVQERDSEILKRKEEKRKEELEKAKKLKKFSGRTSSVNVSPSNPRAALNQIVDNFFAGNL